MIIWITNFMKVNKSVLLSFQGLHINNILHIFNENHFYSFIVHLNLCQYISLCILDLKIPNRVTVHIILEYLLTLTMSDIFRYPYEKTMAFGGVATGSMKAKDALRVQGIITYRGLTPIDWD